MSSLTKLFLLPTALAASPLLLAAGQLPNLDSMSLACGIDELGDHTSIDDIINSAVSSTSNQAVDQLGYVVQPISSSPQAIVTSEQEWLSVGGQATTAAEADIQDYCINKEEPGTAATEEASDVPSGELPDLGSESVNTETTTPVLPTDTSPDTTPATAPAATEPAAVENPDDSSAPPQLIERPTAPPPSDPSRDPSNFTPEDPAPTPFDGIVEPTLESLPDGSYRYLSGNFEYANYTDQQIVDNGGSVFLLTKVGNEITGDLRPRLDLPGICITGTVSDDVVSGAAYPHEATDLETTTDASELESTDAEGTEASSEVTDSEATELDTEESNKESIREIGDTFEPYGSGALQIRRSRIADGQLYYQEAVLDLSGFSRINAGSALAPTECDAPNSEDE